MNRLKPDPDYMFGDEAIKLIMQNTGWSRKRATRELAKKIAKGEVKAIMPQPRKEERSQ